MGIRLAADAASESVLDMARAQNPDLMNWRRVVCIMVLKERLGNSDSCGETPWHSPILQKSRQMFNGEKQRSKMAAQAAPSPCSFHDFDLFLSQPVQSTKQ